MGRGGGGVIQVFAFLPSPCPLAISLIIGELPFCDCILNAVLIKGGGGGGGAEKPGIVPRYAEVGMGGDLKGVSGTQISGHFV